MANIYQVDLKLGTIEQPLYKDPKNEATWVKYGEKDKLPDELIDIYLNSPTHGAIVNGKARLIYGNGIEYVGNDRLKAKDFIQLIQPYLYELVLNFELSNMVIVDLVFGEKTGKLLSAKNVFFNNFRVNSTIKNAWIGSDFTDKQILKKKDIYSGEKHNSIYYDFMEKPLISKSLPVYSIPEYYAAIRSAKQELEIDKFHLNNILNGFSGSTLISISGAQLTEEQEKEHVEKIKQKYTGSEGDKIVVMFLANGGETKIESILPADIDKMFLMLKENITSSLIIGHGAVSPSLFGLQVAGKIGVSNEQIQSYKIFESNYILPRSQYLETHINRLSKIFGVNGGVFKFVRDVPYMPEIGTQEIKEALGAEFPEYVKKYIGYSKPKQNFNFSKKFKFTAIGEPLENYEIIGFRYEPVVNALEAEKELSLFEFSTQDDQLDKIVAILKEKPNISEDELANLMNISKETLIKYLNKLTLSGRLIIDGDAWVVTKNDINNTDYEIKYQYAVAPFKGKAVIAGTREFCKFMIEEQGAKVFSRAEIEQMDNGFENVNDVWIYRGGFYTDSKTGVTTPSCRHIWRQLLLKRK